jgi:hypothetical protein
MKRDVFPLRLRPQRSVHRVILIQLLLINVMIILLDAVVVVFQYAGLFSLQVFFKPVVYGLKLRLEYAILWEFNTACNEWRFH